MGSEIKQIYFISTGEFVKIGIANNPKQRLRDLQTASPVKLKIIYTIPGTENLEKILHNIFDEYRECGEWFRYEGGLKTFIDSFKLNCYCITEKSILEELPIIESTASEKELYLNRDHDKIISFLKFMEVIEGNYNSFESLWGVELPLIITRMAMEHKIPEQKTKILINELFDSQLIFKPKRDIIRLIINSDETKAHELILKNGENFYSNEYLSNAAFSEGGESRTPATDRDKIRVVQTIIKELEEEYGGRAPTDQVIITMRDSYLMSVKQVEDLIRQLKRKGVIYEPQQGYLRGA